MTSQRKKKPFFDYKKQNFLKSEKSHGFGKKMPFFVYVDLVKIRLEIMLTDFPHEKRNLFDYKKQNFSKSKKSHFFPNGLIQALDQKMPNSSLFTFGHNKTSKSKNSAFSKWLTHAFGQKCLFSFI